MPNGRTALFPLDKTQLLTCAEQLGDDEIIGERFGNLSASEKGTGVSVVDWAKDIKEYSEAEILVEEQHHDTYFVHCNKEHPLWICVDNKSPLYPRLRSLHEQWYKTNQSQDKASYENIWDRWWKISGYIFLFIIIIFLLFFNKH